MTINDSAQTTVVSHVPQVPISVDPDTGVWSTDSVPMLYMPRHFFINIHVAVEKELGIDRYSQLLYDAGYQSAWSWCEDEAQRLNIQGVPVFAHYMKRISQRGWGQFTIDSIDLDLATATISVKNSAFVLGQAQATHHADYIFTGWFAGAMDQILSAQGSPLRTVAKQTQSEADPGADVGLFAVAPR